MSLYARKIKKKQQQCAIVLNAHHTRGTPSVALGCYSNIYSIIKNVRAYAAAPDTQMESVFGIIFHHSHSYSLHAIFLFFFVAALASYAHNMLFYPCAVEIFFTKAIMHAKHSRAFTLLLFIYYFVKSSRAHVIWVYDDFCALHKIMARKCVLFFTK